MNSRKWLIGGVIVVAVGGLVAANLLKSGSQPTSAGAAGPKSAPIVKVAAAERQDLTKYVTAAGQLEATGTQEIRAPFGTTQVRLLVGIGDKVKAGDVIAELVSDSQRIQVASQEASVARAESQVAQLLQKATTDPLTLSQRYESAKANLIQAEQGLLTVVSGSTQQVEQARSALLAVQNRSASINAQVEQSRSALQQAENTYRANPLAAGSLQAYEQAKAAYESALKSANDSARQVAADLAQAQEALRIAEQKAQAGEGGESPAVQQARSQVEGARQALEAARIDLEHGNSSDQLRAAQADLSSARELLAIAREKLAQATLKAPADGVILTVAIKSGQPAQENQLLVEMGVLDTLTIKVRADEVDVASLRPGQSLVAKSNAYLQEHFDGEVTRVAAQSTQAQQNSYYEVQGLVKNPEGKLRAGMNAEASIQTDSRTNVVVVGLESLREEGDEAFVLVVKDHQVHLTPVKLGLRTTTQVEILEGLGEGDQVVVGPYSLVRSMKDGAPVRVDEAQAPARRGP